MKNRVKTTALLLVLLLILPILASCGKNGSASGDKNEKNEEYVFCPTAEDVTFEGKSFTILAGSTETSYELAADENGESRVSRAMYERNVAIEELFKVEIKTSVIPAPWGVDNEFINTVTDSVLSGAGAYDLITGPKMFLCEAAMPGCYLNILDLPYVSEDLDERWFFSDLIDEMTINGRLFYLAGDYNLSALDDLYALYYNKETADKAGIEDIYSIVEKGEWTIDKAIEMTKKIETTVDGDKNYGYLIDYESTLDVFNAQFDIRYMDRDESGLPFYDVDSEKIEKVIKKMTELINSDSSRYPWGCHVESPCLGIFEQGNALFLTETLKFADDWKKEDVDFGILPLPKWDADQKDHQTLASNDHTVSVVPLDAKDTEMTGALISALYQYSNERVLPAFIDDATTAKDGTVDSASAEMIDAIRSGAQFDFDHVHYRDLGTAYILGLKIGQQSNDFDEYFESTARGREKSLTAILHPYVNKAE